MVSVPYHAVYSVQDEDPLDVQSWLSHTETDLNIAMPMGALTAVAAPGFGGWRAKKGKGRTLVVAPLKAYQPPQRRSDT